LGLLGRCLIELNQHAVGALGMKKGDLLTPRADHGLLRDEADAGPLQAGEHPLQVIHLKTHVVDPRSTLLQVAGNARVVRGRLDEFDLAPSQGKEGHGGFLVGHLLDMR
jgi:hypothetical protein